MTYFLKMCNVIPRLTHIFDDALCACDGMEHVEWPVVRKGLSVKLITCNGCISMIPKIVEKEMKNLMDNL